MLLTENLPRAMRAKRGDQEMGVTCISLSKDDSSTFLIGSESGGIFKCSTQSVTTAGGGECEAWMTRGRKVRRKGRTQNERKRKTGREDGGKVREKSRGKDTPN